jgi:uncharacterized protein YjcR
MAGTHKRNTVPMLASLRCGAKTRAGMPCRAPAAKGKRRCRMHGGAKGSGAPKGNQNALKHGTYTRATFLERAEMRELIKESEELLRSLNETEA